MTVVLYAVCDRLILIKDEIALDMAKLMWYGEFFFFLHLHLETIQCFTINAVSGR